MPESRGVEVCGWQSRLLNLPETPGWIWTAGHLVGQIQPMAMVAVVAMGLAVAVRGLVLAVRVPMVCCPGE